MKDPVAGGGGTGWGVSLPSAPFIGIMSGTSHKPFLQKVTNKTQAWLHFVLISVDRIVGRGAVMPSSEQDKTD